MDKPNGTGARAPTPSGQDEEALSSLLLLLNSKQDTLSVGTVVPSSSTSSFSSEVQPPNPPLTLLASYSTNNNVVLSENTGEPQPLLSSSESDRNFEILGDTDGDDHLSDTDDILGENNPQFKALTAAEESRLKLYTMEELRKYFHLPIREVAKALGLCATLLKKICRVNRIKRWPFRQIRSITKSIQSLEIAASSETLTENEKAKFKHQIFHLQHILDLLIQDPNTPGIKYTVCFIYIIYQKLYVQYSGGPTSTE